MSENYSVNFSDLEEFSLTSKMSQLQAFLLDKAWSHVPIVNEQMRWIGNLYAEDIKEADAEQTVEDFRYDLDTFYITEEYQALQYFDIFASYDCNIVPVLNEQMNIVFIVVKELVLQQLEKADFISTSGVSFIVETEITNFSFSQLSQIIEGNNAKIFGLLQLKDEATVIQLLFKTNGLNTKNILSDLRRYNYRIISKHIEDTHHTDLIEKSTYLIKYLNI